MRRLHTLHSAARAITDALIAVTLAPCCVGCARPLDAPTRGVVCAPCWARVAGLAAPLCRTCGDPLPSWRTVSLALERCAACRRHPGAIDGGRSASDYDGVLREIIHAFKYQGRRSLARPLAQLLAAAGDDLLRDAACVVPVPLHPWRRLRRGFNQAADLAQRLGPPSVHALWRTRATVAQAGLSAAARRRNMRGAFRLSPLLRQQTRRSRIDDAVVVLVDDVRTTGATLDACARVLKAAGAREVRALTVARTPAAAGRPGKESPVSGEAFRE
jgi:ComF family protein